MSFFPKKQLVARQELAERLESPPTCPIFIIGEVIRQNNLNHQESKELSLIGKELLNHCKNLQTAFPFIFPFYPTNAILTCSNISVG